MALVSLQTRYLQSLHVDITDDRELVNIKKE
jgi:hypothetical protein